MRYRVLGHSRDNGQKMTLEVEAKSKADAERQGERQNLKIIRAEPLEDAEEGEGPEWETIPVRRTFKMPWLFLFFIVVVGAGYYLWPVISNAMQARMPAASHPAAAPGE